MHSFSKLTPPRAGLTGALLVLIRPEVLILCAAAGLAIGSSSLGVASGFTAAACFVVISASTVAVPLRLEQPIPVNVNTAGRDVLMGVVGLQQDAAVQAVLALRQMEPLSSLAVLFMANPELAAALEGTLATSSNVFRVRARAAWKDQHAAVLAWVVREQNGDIRILQWVEEEG